MRHNGSIMKHLIRGLLATVVLFCAATAAQAQIIDDIEFRQEGPDAVVQIKFTTPIQYRRPVISRSGDLVQIFYDVLPNRDPLNLTPGERRVVGGAAEVPELIITDESVNRNNRNRKLVVRLSKATPFKVRAGRGNQVIEIILNGLGQSVRAVATLKPGAVAASERRFVITLQTSSDPSQGLTASVPARLQEYQTFTSRRIVDGKTVYDTNIGYFATQKEAETALALVSPRFRTASIATIQPGAGLEQQPEGPQSATAQQTEASAAVLLSTAQTAYDRGEFAAALESLNQLLNLPANQSSRRGQELAGLARLKLGDNNRARAELEQFLTLYPTGEDSERVRKLLDTIPKVAEVPAAPPAPPPATWSGSVSAFYFGGQSKERNQDFQNSPISGLPELVSDNTISSVDQSQIQTNVDLNWRYRDNDTDMRFVFRNAYTGDLKDSTRNKNRLSALYFDHRSIANGTSIRIGRQSPSGGGVLNRFDGVQAGYVFAPKWKVSAAAGVPTDKLLDSKRYFYGFWVDADALTKEFSGSLYFNQQIIDKLVDRRAVGTELRYFNGGLSASAQLDYDTRAKGLNIGSLQATWQLPDTTVFNVLYDYRATPILSLGNVLFFQDPAALTPAQRVTDLIAGGATVQSLRDQVNAITAYQTQARIGVTSPISRNWQVGADVSLTNVGEVKPVPVILPTGQASTGNIYSVGAQLIGSNLYSVRDTHVFNANFLKGPTYRGTLLSYNNLTSVGDKWQVEPSVRYYVQNDSDGSKSERISPGLRLTYRILQQVTVESELTYEHSTSTRPGATGTGDRVFYYLGGRYDF